MKDPVFLYHLASNAHRSSQCAGCRAGTTHMGLQTFWGCSSLCSNKSISGSPSQPIHMKTGLLRLHVGVGVSWICSTAPPTPPVRCLSPLSLSPGKLQEHPRGPQITCANHQPNATLLWGPEEHCWGPTLLVHAFPSCPAQGSPDYTQV